MCVDPAFLNYTKKVTNPISI